MDIFANVDKAPEELKVKMAKTSNAFKRSVEAKKQSSLWEQENIIASAELKAAQDDFNDALNRWDMTTNILPVKSCYQ